MSASPDQLAAIRARLSAITPGPWIARETDQSDPLIVRADYTGDPNGIVVGFEVGGWGEESNWVVAQADAEFIAHAPADMALLLEECDRLAEFAAGADGCLDMVRETLAAILGEEKMKGTPPMFYNDAIRSALYQAVMGKLDAAMYPADSLYYKPRITDAVVAGSGERET